MKQVVERLPACLVYEAVEATEEGLVELYRCRECGAEWAAIRSGDVYVLEPVDEHSCPACECEQQPAGVSSPPSSNGDGSGSGGQQGPARDVSSPGGAA